MAPAPKKFDYLVLGAGSGGIASVRRAGEFGIRGAVIEKGPLGGTCVSFSLNKLWWLYACTIVL